jgi:hypothetical protein
MDHGGGTMGQFHHEHHHHHIDFPTDNTLQHLRDQGWGNDGLSRWTDAELQAINSRQFWGRRLAHPSRLLWFLFWEGSAVYLLFTDRSMWIGILICIIVGSVALF